MDSGELRGNKTQVKCKQRTRQGARGRGKWQHNTTDKGHRICLEFFQPSQIKRVAHNEAMHKALLQDVEQEREQDL